MDVNDSLRDMITPAGRRIAPGHPEPGTYVTDPSDGARILVDRSVRMPNGKIVVFGLDDTNTPRRVYL